MSDGWTSEANSAIGAWHELLAAEIRRRRKAAGLTQAQLASMTGYSREYGGRAERPESGFPSLDLIHALDRVFDAAGDLLSLYKKADAERHARRHSHSSHGSGQNPRASDKLQSTLDPRSATRESAASLREVDSQARARELSVNPALLDSQAAEIAKAVRAELGDAVEPVAPAESKPNNEIESIRSALLTPRGFSRTLFRKNSSRPALPIAYATIRTERAWATYQAGMVSDVVVELPNLISRAQDLEDSATPTSRDGWRVSARSHHLAATTLAKIGQTDLGWIAAERAMRAADQADDPLVLASAARAGTHALLASGRFDDAVELGGTAAEWLRSQVRGSDPAALSLLGMILLRTAIAAARRGDRAAALELIDQAQIAADRLGGDANYWQTGFGPRNVALHRFSALLDLGDIDFVVRYGRQFQTDGMPMERRVSHMIDVARALEMATRDEDATQLLLEAEQIAPHIVHRVPGVQRALRSMYRRTALSSRSSWGSLGALAQRCGAIA